MKKLLLSSMVLAIFALSNLVFQMTSCKKAEAQTTNTYPIQGLWVGTFSANGIMGEAFYSLIIYSDGTLVTRGKGSDNNYYYSSGNWTLSSDNIFSGIVSFVTPGPNPVTQTITAKFSNTGVLTNGIWKDVVNLNGGMLAGTYPTMKRVN